MSEEFATPTAEAVTQESAPVAEETAVNETASAPVAETTEKTTVDEESEPSKAVKELISQRKKRQEAEKEAAYWRGQAEARVQAPPVAPPPVKPSTAPKAEDFDTWEEYESAKDEWVITQAELRMMTKAQQAQAQQRVQTVQQTFQQKIAKAAEADPTILEAVQDPDLPISQGMAQILYDSDSAPQLIKWLDNNRKEAARIAKMQPLLAAKEMGMIEARLQNTPKPTPPKKVSQAPEPITTVKPSGSTIADEDNLPMDQWIKRRNNDQFKRR